MKSIFILFGVFMILNSAHSIHIYFPREIAACGSEVGLTGAKAKEAASHNELRAGCIIACAYNKLGALIDGKFSVNGFYKILDSIKDSVPNYEELKEGVGICFADIEDSADKTECELGLEFSQCLRTYMN